LAEISGSYCNFQKPKAFREQAKNNLYFKIKNKKLAKKMKILKIWGGFAFSKHSFTEPENNWGLPQSKKKQHQPKSKFLIFFLILNFCAVRLFAKLLNIFASEKLKDTCNT